jgi:hypothetical protein
MANKRHQRSNPGEGRGNTFPPSPLCPNIKLYQRAIRKTITQATCQLPYSHQKTVQPMGSTLSIVARAERFQDIETISWFTRRLLREVFDEALSEYILSRQDILNRAAKEIVSRG